MMTTGAAGQCSAIIASTQATGARKWASVARTIARPGEVTGAGTKRAAPESLGVQADGDLLGGIGEIRLEPFHWPDDIGSGEVLE